MALAPAVQVNLPGYPFNNFPSVATISALRAISSAGLTDGDNYVVKGEAVVSDGGGGVFTWNDGSLVADNGISIIRPNDTSPGVAGRWILAGSAEIPLNDDLQSIASFKGAGLLGYSPVATYDPSSVGYEVQRDARTPATVFPWQWGANVSSLCQTYTNVDMPNSGLQPSFGIVRHWEVNYGEGTTPYQVGAAYSMRGTGPNAGNFYVMNLIGEAASDFGGDATIVLEVNLNTNNFDHSSVASEWDIANVASPYSCGITVVSGGSHLGTCAAFFGCATAAGDQWRSGLIIGKGCRYQDIEAAGDAPVGIRLRGTRSGAGIDTSTMTGAVAMLVGNNQGLYALTTTSAAAEILKLNNSNALVIGSGVTGGIFAAKDFHQTPSASISPTVNGELVVEATSNTTLTFKLKGTDGTVRTGTIALS